MGPRADHDRDDSRAARGSISLRAMLAGTSQYGRNTTQRMCPWTTGVFVRRTAERSEEHTSELQSRRDLVCRLLLEKTNVEQETNGHYTNDTNSKFNTTSIREINSKKAAMELAAAD